MADPVVAPAAGGQGDAAAAAIAAAAAAANGVPANGVVTPPADGTPPTEVKAWYADFKNADLRGYSEVKGFKDPETLAESYRNMEKLLGVPQERLLKIPESTDDAEAMKPVLARLGLAPPETPEGYKFTELENVDKDFAIAAQTWMLEANISPKQASILAAKQIEWQAAENAKYLAQATEEASADMGRLQAEWGAKYNDKLENARRAMRQFGVDETVAKDIEAHVGAAKLLKLFNSIGEATSEARFVEGGGVKPGFGMTSEGAQVRIKELMSDKEWSKRYLGGGAVEKKQMTELQQVAYPGSIQQ